MGTVNAREYTMGDAGIPMVTGVCRGRRNNSEIIRSTIARHFTLIATAVSRKICAWAQLPRCAAMCQHDSGM